MLGLPEYPLPSQVRSALGFSSDKLQLAHRPSDADGSRHDVLTVNAPKTLVHQKIEEQVEKDPNASAICTWDGDMTYAELWQKSSRMSAMLKGCGVGPEVLVPFCLERSAWAIVAILSILRAGGAFVPLDPSHPRSRLEHIVGATKARFIVTSNKLASFSQGLAPELFIVDQEVVDYQCDPPLHTQYPSSDIQPSNLAYVLFTSGSTGVPKGVLVERLQLSTSAVNIGNFATFGSATRVLHFASYSFDACIFEIMCTLVYGGCICIPSDQERMDDIALAATRMRATCAFFTPSFLSILQPEDLPTFDTIIVGGEKVPSDLMHTWVPHVRLINGYGPTECCVICVMINYSLDNARDGLLGSAVSGTPWVVDPDDQEILMPYGSIGELVLEGPMVGRGYLNDQAASSEAFVQAPRWSHMLAATGEFKSRFYKTGDLVQYDSKGNLVYLRRKDTQVKLRGQRFELEEVEHHLRQNVSVSLQVAAEVVTGPRGTEVLVALVGSTSRIQTDHTVTLEVHEPPELEPIVGELTRRLKESLPPYMVPTAYIPVSCLHLTVAGKLDRRWVREYAAMSITQSSIPSAVSLPVVSVPTQVIFTESEAMLRNSWAKLLKLPVESIGLDDNFFLHGGDSITAIRLAAELRKVQIALRVQDMFQNPTL
ncbi:hypothetical protein BDV96DRAFT_501853, partial [Lophiotrema nucula]